MTDEQKERRDYCRHHCYLSEMAKKAVPRWVFMSAIGSMMTISIVFAGWQTSVLETMNTDFVVEYEKHKNDVNKILTSQELHIEKRINDAQFRYTKDVDIFISLMTENSRKLEDLKGDIQDIRIRQGEIAAKQDLVLEKVGLTGGGFERPRG